MPRSSNTMAERLPNPHPGEILLQDFLKPMSLTQTALARAIGVPPRRINEIVLGKRGPSPPTPICGSPAISASAMDFSCNCRLTMT